MTMNRNHANRTGTERDSSIWVLADAETVRSVRTAFRGRPFAVRSIHDLSGLREAAAASPPSVLIVAEGGAGLDPEIESLVAEFAGEVRTIVVGRESSAERVVAAMRCGASDFLPAPFRPAELRERVERLLSSERERTARREDRLRRLEKLCRRLTRSRTEAGEREASLSRELNEVRESLAGRQADAAAAGELRGLLAGELELEKLLRTGVEHLVARTGGTNAAVFLPTDAGWRLGVYVRLDLPRALVQPALDRLAAEVCPEIAQQDHLLRFDDTREFAESIGEECAESLGRCGMIAWPCTTGGECRAVFVLFRDAARPYDDALASTLDSQRKVFAESIARAMRIHHRNRAGWPVDRDGNDESRGSD
jgi:DNA-binding response OmpR family regulator